jgi:hypothetical protein
VLIGHLCSFLEEMLAQRAIGTCLLLGTYSNSGCHFFACTFVIRAAISDQNTDPWYLEDSILFDNPNSQRMCKSCSRNVCITACHGLSGQA